MRRAGGPPARLPAPGTAARAAGRGRQLDTRPTPPHCPPACRDDAGLASRRRSHLAASTSYACAAAALEDDTDFYGQLTLCAEEGAVAEAEEVLERMVGSGLELTPAAYHGLIFSCMRAGSADAAAEALSTMIETGAQPLAESYAVVIYACAMSDDFDGAEAVYNSLIASGADQFPGWLCYLRGLTSAGLRETDEEDLAELVGRLEALMEAGRLEGWYADGDLYEDILGLLCEDPETALLAEDVLFHDLQMRAGAGAETRHFNCVLRAEAVFMGTHNALATLEEMAEGGKGPGIRPDIGSYNAVIEGAVVERMQGFSYATATLEGLVADATRYNIQMDKRTHTLLLMFYLEDHNLDRVLFELREVERLAAPGRLLEHLSDHWLERLMGFLLDAGCIIELTRLLCLLAGDDRALPLPLTALDEGSLSFYTRWLPVFLQGQHLGRRTAGLEKYEVEEEEELLLVNDHDWVNADNAIVDPDTGVQVPVKELSMGELRAELEAKGLDAKGLKIDLVRRVQGSRGNKPRSVREMMAARAAEAAAQAAKDDEKQSELVEAGGMQLVQAYIQEWHHGRLTRNVVETSLLEPEARTVAEEEKHFEELTAMDLPQEVKELLKERRKAFNRKDSEVEFELDHWVFDTSTPEFRALNPNFEGRAGYGERLTWPVWGRGARLAYYMLELAVELGAGASFEDFAEILLTAIEEDDVETATAAAVKMFLESDINFSFPDKMSQFYSKALLLCLQHQRFDYAGTVAEMMMHLELEPLGVLSDWNILPACHQLGLRVVQQQQQAAELRAAAAQAGEPAGAGEAARAAEQQRAPAPEEGGGSRAPPG